MRILVTGGAGFIGSNLVDVLMKQGHEVTVIDNLSVGKASNIEHHLDSDRFHFVNDSILNMSTLERLVRHTDLIYHMAAVVGPKYVVDDPLGTIVTNVRGTENVLELAYKYWVRSVIASSSEVYGKSMAVPWSEDDDRLLGPTTVSRWSYSDAKAIDEYFALAYAKKGLPISAVRYFNAYGPRLDPKGYGSVIARFINQAIKDEPLTVYDNGQQTRCFTYVSDTVEGTMRAATLKEAVGLVFNIGSNVEKTILELAQLIRQLTGSASEIVHVTYEDAFGTPFEDVDRRVPDVTRAQETLGFLAQTPLKDGLQRTLAWFRDKKIEK
ncbi:MAG: NAD-dependent epimerase/dehydratase family protein [Chloroflexi bacterium]|nr:NAD-dependent epimerase/dehydratase family protein [Chloroflexota bacterium]